MKPSTPQQRQILHVLMRNASMDDDAMRELKLNSTNGRTESTKEMTFTEADRLIKALKGKEPKKEWQPKPGQAQRRKILSICHDMRWFEMPQGNAFGVSVPKLNEWLLAKGKVKKELNSMTVDELNQTVTQFESIQKKAYK